MVVALCGFGCIVSLLNEKKLIPKLNMMASFVSILFLSIILLKMRADVGDTTVCAGVIKRASMNTLLQIVAFII